MTPKHLHVLSFNASLAPFVRQPYQRIDLLARQKETLQADIINLQEVHTYDMLWRLRRQLTHLPYASCKSGLVGPLAGLVTLSKWPIHSSQLIRLSFRKGMLITSLDDVQIVNVHLLANTDGDWSVNNKFYPKQKAQLAQLQTALKKIEQPIVLSGDFNLAKTSPLYTDFIRQGEWQDATAGDNSPTFHREFLPHDRKTQRIDYVFTKGNVTSLRSGRVFKERVAGKLLSNHMGLLVRLEL